MKKMRIIDGIAIVLLILSPLFFGCETTPVAPPLKVDQPSAPIPETKPGEAVDAAAGKKLLFDIAEKDACASFSYAEQGKAPASYLKGLVSTYVKTICESETDVYKIGSQAVGDPAKDALAWYGLKPATPTDRLNTVFAMMIGSNARESSWRPCVGRDVGAKASDLEGCLRGSGSTCEAGLAQTSYNSIAKTGPLRDLFNGYMEYPRGCFKETYYGKITCSDANWKNWGSDPNAVAFQKMSKECPGFTVESGLIMFRTNRSHYGPLNRKLAEVVPACVGMFKRVRQALLKQPSLCHVL